MPLLLRDGDAQIDTRWMFFENGVGVSADRRHTLSYENCEWTIRDQDGSPVARASTRALHPTTIFLGEWMGRNRDDSYDYCEMHFVHEDLRTHVDNPILIDLLGRDFFMRHRPPRPVWYFDPNSSAIVHSGAKVGVDGTKGVRYCSICDKLVSANNFVHQHMRRLHPDEPIPGQSALAKLDELLSKMR